MPKAVRRQLLIQIHLKFTTDSHDVSGHLIDAEWSPEKTMEPFSATVVIVAVNVCVAGTIAVPVGIIVIAM